MVYRAKILRNSAIFQMLCGSLMILLGIGSIFAVHHWSTYAGFGVWVGFWVRKDINLMKLIGSIFGPLTFVALLINLRDSFRMMTLDFYEKNFFLPILLQYCNHVNKGLFLLLLTFLQRW